MLRRFVPDPFLSALIGTLLAATILPARGTFATAVHWLSIATVILLFFFHGAKLARGQIVAGIVHWRLHLAILGSTFAMFPLVGVAGTRLLDGLVPPTLATGLLFLCCLPSTVQSAIAFVAVAHGNVAAAVASASVSQMLGIVLTPLLMALLASTHAGGGTLTDVGEVALQILAPFALGHALRPLIAGWVHRHRGIVAVTDRSTILIAVYGAFSAAVVAGLWRQLPVAALASLFLLCGILLAIGLGFTWLLGRLAGFDDADRATLLFCGTKKSLVQGVPMARVLFSADQSGMILLPIMLFHQLQLMACAVIARRMGARHERRIATEETDR